MRDLTRRGFEALYVRGIIGDDALRTRLSEAGFPGAGLEELASELERAKRAWEDAGKAGTREAPRPEPWMPEPVWELALGVVSATEAGAALLADGWTPVQASDLVALGQRLVLEVVDARARERRQEEARLFPR